MRLLSMIFSLGTGVMAWLFYKLYPLSQWALRKLFCISSRLLGYAARLKAIVWRQDGEREVIEERDENQSPTRSSPEESESEGRVEAGAGGRAADVDPEPRQPRQQRGEQAEDDFDRDEYRVKTSDELYCRYDSTWETEEDPESTLGRNRRPAAPRHYKFNRFENAAKDMHNYRHDYPYQPWRQPRRKRSSGDKPNLNFYLGLTPSVPDGINITDFHKEWHGQYDALEYVHTYIQWLFPLQEPGMNAEASTLTKEEINDFCANPTAKANLLKSYKLMLDFYGITLYNEETGEVRRAPNWIDRFNNLNSHTHNNLRITRILKCLGTLGYRHYQAPLVRFFLEETLIEKQLPNVKESVLNYFVFAVLDKRERRSLIKFAYLNYSPRDEFVWCPKKIQKLWSRDDHSQEYLTVDSRVPYTTRRDCTDSDSESL